MALLWFNDPVLCVELNLNLESKYEGNKIIMINSMTKREKQRYNNGNCKCKQKLKDEIV